MATVQEPRAGNRFESFVEAELSRARRRIRSQDIGAAALGLLAGTLAYALGMVLLDRWLDLPDTARQVGLFAYLAAAVAYAALIITRPLRREVNPYFAARRVERTVPGAKNSVISWLDLHTKPLPESIKAAVSQKAAADLKKADVDEVVRNSRLPWIGGLAGGLFVAALILFFLLRPNQFLSLLGRTFAPFESGAIASQTSLDLLQPAGGNVTVPVNAAIDFRVEVLGRVPDPTATDAVRLRFRYNPADPVWEEIRLDASPRQPREFALRMPAGRVQNGFVYQIAGGDAAPLEYRVQVRSSPLIEEFEVGYHFRPYLHFRDQTATNPNIESYRGTQVTLTVRTNRTVQRGELAFHGREGQKMPPPIPAEAVPDQPNALRFRFVLDEDAKYTIKFWSAEGEDNGEPIPYTIKVLTDHPPQVDVTVPAPETLPVNGTITVEGKAADDFGITAMRLCLRLPNADRPTELAPKPYRPGKVFKFADDTYPRALDYKDFLPLDQLKTPLGAPVTLRPGLVFEYWLEAKDNCDPNPNVGKSKIYKVTLGEPQAAEDKRAGDKQAAGDKAQHDQKQDQGLAKENQAKQQAGEQGDKGEQKGDKPGDQGQDGQPQKPADANSQPNAQDQAIEKQARDLRDKMERARQQSQGGAKDQPEQHPGQSPTDPGQPKGDKNDGNQQNANPTGQPNDQKEQGNGDKQSDQPQPNGDKGPSKPERQPAGQTDPGAAKPTTQQQPDSQGGKPNPADVQNPNATKPDQPKAGDQGEQPKGESNPGAAKPQLQNGTQGNGEKKDQLQADKQLGQAKPMNDSANGQQSGTEKPGPPKAGGDSGNPKPNDGGHGPTDNPKKDPGDNGQQKQNSGAGQPGNKNQTGDQSGAGPKNDPNNGEPKGQPDPMDPGKEGAGGKTGSGQAGGKPNDPKPQNALNGAGQGGTPDAGEAKPKSEPTAGQENGQAKPAGDAGDKSQAAGKPAGQGELTDAPKGGRNQPGAASKAQPKTDGAESAGPPSGNKSNDRPSGKTALEQLAQDLKSRNPRTRQAAENRVQEIAKELAKQGTGQQPANPETDKAAEAQAKEMLSKLDKDPEARQALEKAWQGAAQKAAQEEIQKLSRDLKSSDAATRDAAKERAKQLAQGDLKPLADDAKSTDPQRQKQAKDFVDKNAGGDPRTQQALLDALKGDGKPSEQPDKKSNGQGNPEFNGNRSGDKPLTSPPPEPGTPPDPKYAKTTSDLQLEQFPKNPSKELLKDLGMSEAEYRQFLKAAAELQKKRQAEAEHNRERGSSTGSSAANSGAKRVQGGTDKANQLERNGASLPPEEYREGYKGFTEEVSKTAGGAKKE